MEAIDYHLAIPVTPEQFADPDLRAEWQREKGMVVLRLWSEQHRRTPIDVFISEPFGFAEEYARAQWQTISEGVKSAGDCSGEGLAYFGPSHFPTFSPSHFLTARP